jgi:hypothetical protein
MPDYTHAANGRKARTNWKATNATLVVQPAPGDAADSPRANASVRTE